jgi:hypothetical protein
VCIRARGSADFVAAITVDDGSSYEVEFRSEEKARHAHDMILYHVMNE